jgi:nicotinamidase-related amidase
LIFVSSPPIWETWCDSAAVASGEGVPGYRPAFDTNRIACVFHKGIDPLIDSYSTFFDNAHRRYTGFAEYLKE